MRKVKILIADDSAIYRSSIRTALQGIPWVEVVGTASNGKIALERINQTPPDLLILDLEMPEMDGLQTLSELARLGFTCKVLVFSSLSKRGAEITMEALRLGASDFISKPNGSDTSGGSPAEMVKALLEPKIIALFPDLGETNPTPESKSSPQVVSESSSYPKATIAFMGPKVILIGSSTGGPSALEKIFSRISPPVSCPIVITQHMPPIFTATFAERLSRISGVPAAEGKDGEPLQNNRIYVAPGNYHMRLTGTADDVRIALDQGPLIHSVRPAVDPLFSSAAAIFGNRCLAFVLTGMGADGCDGTVSIKEAGGGVVIQNQESCVVFGMPGAVFARGAYDKIADLDGIADILIGFSGRSITAGGAG